MSKPIKHIKMNSRLMNEQRKRSFQGFQSLPQVKINDRLLKANRSLIFGRFSGFAHLEPVRIQVSLSKKERIFWKGVML